MFALNVLLSLNIEVHFSHRLVPDQPSAGGKSGTGSSNSGDQSTGKGKVSTGSIVGIVAAFLGAIVLCILLVVFHRKERRLVHYCRGVVKKG